MQIKDKQDVNNDNDNDYVLKDEHESEVEVDNEVEAGDDGYNDEAEDGSIAFNEAACDFMRRQSSGDDAVAAALAAAAANRDAYKPKKEMATVTGLGISTREENETEATRNLTSLGGIFLIL